MMETKQLTLWQITQDASKEAIKLYFQPVQQLISLVSKREKANDKQEQIEGGLPNIRHKFSPQFDSMDDLENRVARLRSEDQLEENLRCQLAEIESLLQEAQSLTQSMSAKAGLNEILATLQLKLRELEIERGIEKHLYPPSGERTRGASGD